MRSKQSTSSTTLNYGLPVGAKAGIGVDVAARTRYAVDSVATTEASARADKLDDSAQPDQKEEESLGAEMIDMTLYELSSLERTGELAVDRQD